MNMAGANKRKRQEEVGNPTKIIHFSRELSEVHVMEWEIPRFLTGDLESFSIKFETGTTVSTKQFIHAWKVVDLITALIDLFMKSWSHFASGSFDWEQ
jgi:hypothetical protein